MRSHIAQPGHPTNRNLSRRLEQTWESDSMIIASNSNLAVKVRDHLIASASA